MALQHGAPQPQQQQEMYTDEQKRDIERGMILLTIRRYMRFLCLGIFVLDFLYNLITNSDEGIGVILAYAAFVAVFWYAVLWVITMVGGNFCIKIYLYCRDLFTSKNTRI